MAFENPNLIWFIPLCLLLGVGLAMLTYFKKKTPFSKQLTVALFVLRSLGISLLAFLLLGPLIPLKDVFLEKPILVVLQDNSQSMLLSGDSMAVKNHIREIQSQLEKEKSSAYSLEWLTLSGDANNDQRFPLFSSNISGGLKQIEKDYRGENVAGVILLSDGIVNHGSPLYQLADNYNFPLFTVGYGDSIHYPDIAITTFEMNSNSLKGNQFPLRVGVTSDHIASGESRLTIKQNGKTVFQQTLNFKGNSDYFSKTLYLDAKEIGPNKIEVSVRPLQDEHNSKNNYRVKYIEVTEEKNKVLLLYQQPSADVSAIHRALKDKKGIEVAVLPANKRPENLQQFKVVYLYEPNKKMLEAVADFSNGLGIFYHSLTSRNALEKNGYLGPVKGGEEMATATINPSFSLFDFPFPAYFNDMLPVNSFLKIGTPKGSGEMFLENTIEGIGMQQPLVWYGALNNQHRAVFAMNGFWKWRMEEFRVSKSFETFDRWIFLTTQYLGKGQSGKRLSINVPEVIYAHSTSNWGASIWNKSGQITQKGKIKLKITGPENMEAAFSPTGAGYQSKIQGLAPGVYSWKATATLGKENFEQKGKFVVIEHYLERSNLTADFNSLQSIATSNGGAAFGFWDNPQEITNQMRNQMDIRPIEHVRIRPKKLVDWIWYLVFVGAIFATEWFLRRINGGY